MFVDDEDILDFAGDTTEEIEEEEETVEETADTAEEAEKEATAEEPKEEEKPKDSKIQALDAERARRKQAEKELRELRQKIETEKASKEEAEALSKEREAYKKKILDGDLVDEDVAEKLLDVFGDDIIKSKLANEKRTEEENFEKDFAALKQDELFMDADVYKSQMKEFAKKGLSLEEAYLASAGRARFVQMKKDMEVELEQKLLNNEEKADKIDLGHAEQKSEVKNKHYTKREQEIAKETGLDVKEVHKRLNIDSLEDFENL